MALNQSAQESTDSGANLINFEGTKSKISCLNSPETVISSRSDFNLSNFGFSPIVEHVRVGTFQRALN